MRKHSGLRKMELCTGILAILLGIASIIRPEAMLTSVVIIYGIVAIFMGIADIFLYIELEHYTGFGSVISLISGIFSVMTGFMLLVYPNAGKWALAILFPIWFMAHCIGRLTHLGYTYKIFHRSAYYLTLLTNIAGIILSFIMLLMPGLTFVSFGLVVGTALLLLGINSIILALN